VDVILNVSDENVAFFTVEL